MSLDFAGGGDVFAGFVARDLRVFAVLIGGGLEVLPLLIGLEGGFFVLQFLGGGFFRQLRFGLCLEDCRLNLSLGLGVLLAGLLFFNGALHETFGFIHQAHEIFGIGFGLLFVGWILSEGLQEGADVGADGVQAHGVFDGADVSSLLEQVHFFLEHEEQGFDLVGLGQSFFGRDGDALHEGAEHGLSVALAVGDAAAFVGDKLLAGARIVHEGGHGVSDDDALGGAVEHG